MSVFTPVYSFSEALAEKKIDLANDTINVALSNTTPDLSWTQYTDLTEISAGNGYSTGGTAATLNASSQSNGLYKYIHENVVFTASGGDIGPLQYIWFYSDTATNKDLMGYLDYGTATTIADGDNLTIVKNDNGLFQIA